MRHFRGGGDLCKNCASNKSSHLYQVRPERFALAIVAGLAAGTLVGYLLQYLTGMFLIFMLFLGPMIGGAVGEVILRATGRKRGLKLEILAGASVLVGAGISLLLSHFWRFLWYSPTNLILYGVAVALMTAAVTKIRYL